MWTHCIRCVPKFGLGRGSVWVHSILCQTASGTLFNKYVMNFVVHRKRSIVRVSCGWVRQLELVGMMSS